MIFIGIFLVEELEEEVNKWQNSRNYPLKDWAFLSEVLHIE